MRNLRFALIGVIAITIFVCSGSNNKSDNGSSKDEALIAAQKYFANNLKPIIDNKCFTCHGNHHNRNNSSNYSVFDNARKRAAKMFNKVNKGSMPMGGPELPQSEKDIFKTFKDLVDQID